MVVKRNFVACLEFLIYNNIRYLVYDYSWQPRTAQTRLFATIQRLWKY